MTGFLEVIEFWHWLALGLVLMILEVFLPGAFFIWFGAAAVIMGAVTFIIPELHWALQVSVYAGLSLVLILAWLAYKKAHPSALADNKLNNRTKALIGKTAKLITKPENGNAKIRLGDSEWKVEIAGDAEIGDSVVITGAADSVLKVEKSQI